MVEDESEGYRRHLVLDGLGRQTAVLTDREDVDGVVGLGRHDQVVAAGREADFGGRLQEERIRGVAQPKDSGRTFDRAESAAVDSIPAHGAVASCVEDVQQVAAQRQAGWELTARRDHLPQPELVPTDLER